MKYGVLLEGRNFELRTEQGTQNLGFFTTRFVKASSPVEAERKALDLVKADSDLNGALVKNRKYEPEIVTTECWREPWWKRLGGRGYTFYSMESERE